MEPWVARALVFALFGYLTGGLLFARYIGLLLNKKDVTKASPDQNPGTYNAFLYGGFACGVLTLLGDLFKGFLPVYLYRRLPPEGAALAWMGLALVLAAPVWGHIFPLFHRFRGGKGVAVSFGCLLGLYPDIRPLSVLVAAFLFFCLVVRVSPNSYKTVVCFFAAALGMAFFLNDPAAALGFSLAAVAVIGKQLAGLSRGGEKEKVKVGLLWKR